MANDKEKENGHFLKFDFWAKYLLILVSYYKVMSLAQLWFLIFAYCKEGSQDIFIFHLI